MNITDICKGQLLLSFETVENLINITPDNIWNKKSGGFVFWQQIVHCITGSLFWLRTEKKEFQEPYPKLNIYPELEKEPENNLSKEQVKELLNEVKELGCQLFNNLDDKKLTELSFVYNKTTNLHVILGQIRHLQYHVGHCDSILRENGMKDLKWIDKYDD